MKRCLLILLLLGALLWAEKPSPKAVIGKIDDKIYTYSEYERILANYFDYYRKQQSTPLTDEDKARLNDQCWNELVGRYIYDKAIKAGKVRITNQELLAEAKKNPPAAVKQIKDLQKNGRFDQKTYEQALSESPDFRSAVLDEVRSLYQFNKLLNAIKAEVDADEDSVRTAWMQDQERIDARIIFFDANKMTSVNATDEEAREYYEGRIEEYRKDNLRRLHYVRFAKVPSHADSSAVRDSVMQLYRELKDGADFAELARERSQDPGSGANGGDLGWFGRGRMVPVFEETAFNTPVGEIAEPVLSQFGWHIIQTTDRRETESGDEVSARHILLRIEPGRETQQLMKTQSVQLHGLASEKGLVEAAAEMGLNVQETPPFQEQDGFIREIGRDANLISFAFSNPEGAVADINYAPSGDILVCAVSAVIPTYYTPFEEEQSRIQSAATRSKRGFYMNSYVQNFVRNLSPEQYLIWAERDSITVIEISNHKKGEPITSIGKQDELDELLFSTPEGSFGPLVSENMRWFLARVDRHTLPDMAIWEQEKKKLIQTARDELKQKHLNDWYYKEYQKVSIIDNRADYYDLSSTRKTQQIQLGG
ncbi:MAG: peptidylprolyl isomerase [Candidatus Syntrophosphaera sp.]|nr:peptidylprolyl isomerase [Candidatus Syntrophosphaera sp.]